MRRATYDDDDDHDDQCCHAIFGKSQDESEHRCPKGEEVFFLSICDYFFATHPVTKMASARLKALAILLHLMVYLQLFHCSSTCMYLQRAS